MGKFGVIIVWLSIGTREGDSMEFAFSRDSREFLTTIAKQVRMLQKTQRKPTLELSVSQDHLHFTFGLKTSCVLSNKKTRAYDERRTILHLVIKTNKLSKVKKYKQLTL